MGNNFISYFTWFRSGRDSLVGDAAVSRVAEEPQVEPFTDKQCVAWEIDVSDWKPRGKGNKTKRKSDVKAICLQENNNVLVGGAGKVTSEETKLVKVTLPTMKAEVKIAQCCDDMEEKKALDLRRW